MKKLLVSILPAVFLFSCSLFLSDEKAISAFSFTDPAVTGQISETDFSIKLTVPFGTDVSALVPTIVHTGTKILPESGAVQDFSEPVEYTVKAGNGSLSVYTVTVLSLPSISATYGNDAVASGIIVPPGAVFQLEVLAQASSGTITRIDVYESGGLPKSFVPPAGSASYSLPLEMDPPLRGGQKNIRFTVAAANGLAASMDCVVKVLSSNSPVLADYPFERAIPELVVADAGIQASPAPSGSVYYFNQLHTRAESDVQLDDGIMYTQSVKRYMAVSGKAIPDDSGYSDRFYHWVSFGIILVDSGDNELERSYVTFPVDAMDRFSGYLYFPKTGHYKVYAYRQRNYNLYPRGVENYVDEGVSTLFFNIDSTESLPAELLPLLPSQYVDCGNQYIREYAPYLVEHNKTDIEKLQSLYHFLVFGDANGGFSYQYYNEAYPNYAEYYSVYYLSSHMLINRRGVCNDFSELFAALARVLGFRVQVVIGYPGQNQPGHEWNRVWANDRWYRVDATWGNGDPGSYKDYAEFYPEFDAVTFETKHEQVFTVDFIERY